MQLQVLEDLTYQTKRNVYCSIGFLQSDLSICQTCDFRITYVSMETTS